VTAIVGNTTMTRQVEGSTSSHGQMGDLPVEFGLGRAAKVDTLMIQFPSGGRSSSSTWPPTRRWP